MFLGISQLPVAPVREALVAARIPAGLVDHLLLQWEALLPAAVFVIRRDSLRIRVAGVVLAGPGLGTFGEFLDLCPALVIVQIGVRHPAPKGLQKCLRRFVLVQVVDHPCPGVLHLLLQLGSVDGQPNRGDLPGEDLLFAGAGVPQNFARPRIRFHELLVLAG